MRKVVQGGPVDGANGPGALDQGVPDRRSSRHNLEGTVDERLVGAIEVSREDPGGEDENVPVKVALVTLRTAFAGGQGLVVVKVREVDVNVVHWAKQIVGRVVSWFGELDDGHGGEACRARKLRGTQAPWG